MSSQQPNNEFKCSQHKNTHQIKKKKKLSSRLPCPIWYPDLNLLTFQTKPANLLVKDSRVATG